MIMVRHDIEEKFIYLKNVLAGYMDNIDVTLILHVVEKLDEVYSLEQMGCKRLRENIEDAMRSGEL